MASKTGESPLLKVSVIIPAYREAATIGPLLKRLLAVDLCRLGVAREILVCDDGSDDGTAEAVREHTRRSPGIRFFRHERNQGKGSAIRTALFHATGDYVLVQDADLEYDPEDHVSLLGPVLQSGAPVVFGSRFLAGRYPQGMRWRNYAANRLLTGLANLLFHVRITDEATCYKLIRTDLLRGLGLRCERFEFCPEVTAKLGVAGIPIVEVPIRYSARTSDEGKKVGWRDAVQATAVLLRHWRLPALRTAHVEGLEGAQTFGIGATDRIDAIRASLRE